MPTRYIQRRAALAPNDISTNVANAIFVDSDDDQLKFTTGASGQTTVDLVTESQTQTLTNKTLTSPTITGATLTTATLTAPVVNNPIVDQALTNITTGNLTLTAALHGGGVITVNDANSANILTLPDATGSGVKFEVVVGTTVATGTLVIAVPDTDNVLQGIAWMATDADSVTFVNAFETAAASDTITLDGTTTGGRAGDYIVLMDIAADKWMVHAFLSGSGTEATPFSAAV